MFLLCSRRKNLPEASFTLPNQKRYDQLISYKSKLFSLFLKALLFSVNCEPLFHRYVYHYGYYMAQVKKLAFELEVLVSNPASFWAFYLQCEKLGQWLQMTKIDIALSVDSIAGIFS